jgi:starch phosphorylase
MRESMARLTPAFSTNRLVRQYTEEHYLSATANDSARAANHGQLEFDLLNWQEALSKH